MHNLNWSVHSSRNIENENTKKKNAIVNISNRFKGMGKGRDLFPSPAGKEKASSQKSKLNKNINWI